MIKKETREIVLARDNHRCQFDVIFGLTEVSGVNRCGGHLELHHRTYERFDKELPEDLITVCKKHHDFITDMIRGQRYSVREYSPKDIEQKTPKFKIRRHENAKISMQDYRDYSPNNAQGRNGRPFRPFYKRDQEDQQKEDEN